MTFDKKSRKTRNSGIELLRLLCMFMIVFLHVLGHGGILHSVQKGTLKSEFIWIIYIASYVAVNCFGMISGYVGLYSRHRYSTLFTLWCQVVYHLVTISLIGKLFRPDEVSLKLLISSFFPLTFNTYWYFTGYVVLFLLMPIFNISISNLSIKRLFYILIGLSILFLNVPKRPSDAVVGILNGYSALWLCYLYLVGAFFRKLEETISFDKYIKWLFLGYVICTLLTWYSHIVVGVISESLLGYIKGEWIFLYYNSLFILIGAICLFLLCSQLKDFKGQYVINKLAKYSFGIFIVHLHPLIYLHFIKDKYRDVAENSFIMLFFKTIIIVIAIYIFSMIVDAIRLYCYNKMNILKFLKKILKETDE